MNRFFTSQEVYEDRLAICKGCKYYFKLTGQCKRCLCFMKVKARIAPMECPEKYWQKTTEIEAPVPWIEASSSSFLMSSRIKDLSLLMFIIR